MPGFSFTRLWAMVVKEFIQLRRDRLTFAMLAGIPLVLLLLFGYAINTDPKNMPTAIVSGDHSIYTRDLVRAMENTGYFRMVHPATDEHEAEQWLNAGDVQFVVHIPADFSHRLLRGERPDILVDADATDPVASSGALATLAALGTRPVDRDLPGSLQQSLAAQPGAFRVTVHRRYNPEGLTEYNIVPGIMGVILTMTMVLMTSLAITRERERGTFETLLATPVRPVEVMLGKITPYILAGYVQITLLLLAAWYLFGIPVVGSLFLLYLAALLFIAANLMVGLTFSTLAKNQMQAMQMMYFFFLPSLLMSGYLFPFRGMPGWAQFVGNLLPLTHFLRVVRGIVLKGNGWAETWPHLWPIAIFLAVMLLVAILRYRETLD
jgi:ABC-2 type transport system permease protein